MEYFIVDKKTLAYSLVDGEPYFFLSYIIFASYETYPRTINRDFIPIIAAAVAVGQLQLRL